MVSTLQIIDITIWLDTVIGENAWSCVYNNSKDGYWHFTYTIPDEYAEQFKLAFYEYLCDK